MKEMDLHIPREFLDRLISMLAERGLNRTDAIASGRTVEIEVEIGIASNITSHPKYKQMLQAIGAEGAGAVLSTFGMPMTEEIIEKLLNLLEGEMSFEGVGSAKALAGGDQHTFEVSDQTQKVRQRQVWQVNVDKDDSSKAKELVLKEYISKEQLSTPYDDFEYGWRLRCNKETHSSNITRRTLKPSDPVSSIHDRRLRNYRIKTRRVFAVGESLRVDVTKVFQVQSQEGLSYEQVVKQGQVRYEVEVECVASPKALEIKDKQTEVAKHMLKVFALLLSRVWERRFLPASMRLEVLTKFWDALSSKSSQPVKFAAPNPVTLERKHFSSSPKSVLEGYEVTEKTDGERRLVYVDGRNGMAYSINSRLVVSDTWLRLREGGGGGGCVLDCECVTDSRGSAKFLVFDAYVIDGASVRDKTLGKRLTDASRVVSGMVPFRRSSTSILVKQFYNLGSTHSSFTHGCKLAWEGAFARNEIVDGLIFTPSRDHVPDVKAKFTWERVLKWKPAEQNSIDFQVNGVSADRGTAGDVDVEATLSVCGGQGETSPITALSMADPKQRDHLRRMYMNRAQWNGQASPFASTVLPRNSRGDAVCENGDVIVEDSIVEFRYDTGERRWKPMRVRRDKTELAGRACKANAISTARSVQRSIDHPITLNHLTVPTDLAEVIASASDATADDDSYYVAEDSSSSDELVHMRKFHNRIKDHLYAFVDRPSSIVDFGVGRGGDINKWVSRYESLKLVLGFDTSSNNIQNPDRSRAGAYVRMLSLKEDQWSHLKTVSVILLPMDATSNLSAKETADALAIQADRDMARHFYGNAGASSGMSLLSVPTFPRDPSTRFSLAVAMFSIHYMFESMAKVDAFCANVREHLRPGGVFVGCCLDGDRVHDLLASSPGGVVQGEDRQGRVLWRIRRGYTGSSPPDFGARIDVFVSTIGQELGEFLVKYDVLRTRMAAFNLVPFSVSDSPLPPPPPQRDGWRLDQVFGQQTHGSFEDIFDRVRSGYAAGGPAAASTNAWIAGLEADTVGYAFSKLHQWFAFQHRPSSDP